MRDNRILAALRAGGVSLGINVQTAGVENVEMVGLAGYDHVMIDWEHGSFGTETVVAMIRAAEAAGVTPIVRVPSRDEVWIKRVLDAGAQGVVVPHVSTAEQAERVVAAARYRSRGDGAAWSRGACPSVRAAGHLASDWGDFAARSNAHVFVAPAIESPEGAANAGAIAAVPGVDALFLGTFDLAHDMGYDGDNSHPRVVAEVERIVAGARGAGTPLFVTLYRGRTEEEIAAEVSRWSDLGAGVFNCASDRRLLTLALRSQRELVRRRTGDSDRDTVHQ